MSNPVMGGRAHLRGLVPGQHLSKETLQRWQVVGNNVSDFNCLRIKPMTSYTDSSVLTPRPTSLD